MIRTTLAVVTLAMFAGAGFAYAAPTASFDRSYVINVVNDATNENDAVDIEQNKLPSNAGTSTNSPAPAQAGQPGHDQELKQLDQEKSDSN